MSVCLSVSMYPCHAAAAGLGSESEKVLSPYHLAHPYIYYPEEPPRHFILSLNLDLTQHTKHTHARTTDTLPGNSFSLSRPAHVAYTEK
mmetsp:Transcript_10605/g.25743  ORF Transcript_10605/g.25743 Transcript_10605/m.25743 type:complete len:89 (-) Transcript_10605:575-841(-)